MPSFSGQISRGGSIVLSAVVGNYFVYTRRYRRLAWSGGFDLAAGGALDASDPYRLTLEDGRSGEIVVDFISVSSRGLHIHFRGLSPLQAEAPDSGGM
jgi:hypothetical protein